MLKAYVVYYQTTRNAKFVKGLRVTHDNLKMKDHIISIEGDLVPEIWDLRDAYDEGAMVIANDSSLPTGKK